MVVLTSAEAPYGIMWASPGWLAVCGFSLAEIMGADLGCIQGPATDRGAVSTLMAAVRQKRGCTIQGLVNYDKQKRARRLRLDPPNPRTHMRAASHEFAPRLTRGVMARVCV